MFDSKYERGLDYAISLLQANWLTLIEKTAAFNAAKNTLSIMYPNRNVADDIKNRMEKE